MPDSAADVTLGEVHRRLVAMDSSNNQRFGAIERRMEAGFTAINAQIAAQGYVHVDRYMADQETARQRVDAVKHAADARVAALESDIDEMKANNKWRDRTLALTALMLVANIVGGVVLLAIGTIGG